MRNGWQDGSAIAMGDGGSDGRQWWCWATVGVTMGDSNSCSMIPIAVNGGGAMDGPNGWQDGSNTSAMAITTNGGRSKEGDGDGNKGGGQAMVTATKRAMATASRVAGNEEGNGNGDKSNGNGVKGGGQWRWR